MNDFSQSQTQLPSLSPLSTGPRFTDELWESIAPELAAIHRMEFLNLLGSGELDAADFQFYMHQDTLYLRGYARSLALLSARSPTPELTASWADAARSASVEETQLHRSVLPNGPDLLSPADQLPSPVCLGYTSFLVAQTSQAPYPVGAAAVLPCFWVYAHVAERLAHQAGALLERNPDHPYAQWIAEYDGEEFHASVEQARGNVDRAAAAASPEERDEMRRAYRTATRYEYLFWDSALHRRPWPDFSDENAQPDENAQADNDNAQTDAQLGTQGDLR
jgi:thiaminase/transcriptional activator TenA